MLPLFRLLPAVLVGLAFAAGPAPADLTDNLMKGTPDLKSAGALAFGPEGILFIGDPQGAAIFAIDTQDRSQASARPLNVDGIDAKIAALLGTTPQEIQINDLRVNPISGNAYLSVHRGRGPDAVPVIVRVGAGGKLEQVLLKEVKFSKVTLPNAPSTADKDRRGQPRRQESITQIGFVDGRVLVSGLSNEEWASTLRAIPFPFKEADKGAGIEIFHGAHGRFETHAPINTFAPYTINGQAHLLAAYTDPRFQLGVAGYLFITKTGELSLHVARAMPSQIAQMIVSTPSTPRAMLRPVPSSRRNCRIQRISSGIPVRMCFEKNHQCGRRSSATASPSLMRRFGYGMAGTLPTGLARRRPGQPQITVPTPVRGSRSRSAVPGQAGRGTRGSGPTRDSAARGRPPSGSASSPSAVVRRTPS